jgi:sugar lactone lactonase YvrE
MFPRLAGALFLLPVGLAAADLVFAEKSIWEVVSSDHQFAEGMAWDREGDFYFTDVPRGHLFRVDRQTGTKTLFDGATGRANGIAFGPDGRLYGCASGDRCIYAWDTKTGRKVAVAEGTQSNDLVVLRDGTIFYTEPAAKLVWRLAAGTFAREVGAKLAWSPNGITVSPDQKTLLVAEFDSERNRAGDAGRPAARGGAGRRAAHCRSIARRETALQLRSPQPGWRLALRGLPRRSAAPARAAGICGRNRPSFRRRSETRATLSDEPGKDLQARESPS